MKIPKIVASSFAISCLVMVVTATTHQRTMLSQLQAAVATNTDVEQEQCRGDAFQDIYWPTIMDPLMVAIDNHSKENALLT